MYEHTNGLHIKCLQRCRTYCTVRTLQIKPEAIKIMLKHTMAADIQYKALKTIKGHSKVEHIRRRTYPAYVINGHKQRCKNIPR